MYIGYPLYDADIKSYILRINNLKLKKKQYNFKMKIIIIYKLHE